MGVPKFFRFISERYPCISELINKDAQVYDFDNLYLDMNGIIHMCSHPDDSNPHFRISEEKIFRDVFHYVAYLFQMINPKKVFFMAVDGVAPRAKMNHQRARRFQSARDAEKLEQKALEKGEVLPESKQFDKNCITPGTVFMARLHEQLRYFIKYKISTDRSWAKCRIVLSGQDAPGEGEHKIMDYIRYLRKRPDHDPNTRHCLYGLDADLIMLGFCTHEPNFSILREEVIFKKNVARPSTPEENNFYLLHLSLLKNYIELEFSDLKDALSFGFDMDKIIDDWVLMGFLVGNDFVPHLPNLLIHNNALPQLYDAYKEILPTLDGYINEDGILNLSRFQVYISRLADIDRKQFEEVYADLKYFEGKTGRRSNKNQRKSLNHVPDNEETFGPSKSSGFKDDLRNLIDATNKMSMNVECEDLIDFGYSDDDDEEKQYDSSEDMFNAEFTLHKKDYYMNKLEYANVTEQVLKSQAEGYIRAIQWILHYYYRGCCSWSWFYPHHYAPFLSDVVNFKDMEIKFDLGKPFKPFEQLLGVLPVASKDLLPEAYHYLMSSKDSPIHSFYPTDFETDLNGKIQQWEAVVLIPFIDEDALLSAMEPYSRYLTEDERQRNSHGPMLIYEYTTEDLGSVLAPEYFPRIPENHALEVKLWNDDMINSPGEIIRGPLPNKYKDAYFPGVPTLKHIDFSFSISKSGVKVFEFPSRNDNFILNLSPIKNKPSLEIIASQLLGKIIWVGWPYLIEAKVLSVTDEFNHISYVPVLRKSSAMMDDEISTMSKVENKGQFFAQWESQKSTFCRHYMTRLGINVGKIDIIVNAVNVKGYKYVSSTDGKLLCDLEWCTVPVAYPLQNVLANIEVAPIARPKLYKTIDEALPIGDTVFIILGSYYGNMAEIVDLTEINKSGRIKVDMINEPEPVISQPEQFAISQYLPLRAAAAKCGVSPILFSRITSSVYVVPKDKDIAKKSDKNVNIGLCLKFAKVNEEVMGFAHRVEKVWLYSMRCVSLVTDYVCRFYDLFQRLESFINMENVFERDLFFDDEENKLSDVVEWLNSQSYKKYPTRKCATIGLDPEELRFIHDSIESQAEHVASQKMKLGLKVKSHVLFKAELRTGNIPPDLKNAKFKLFDRIINVSPHCSVPLGYKGVVVSIIKNDDTNKSVKIADNINCDPVYLIQFDKTFPNGSTVEGIPGKRFYIMQGFNMLNITTGRMSQIQTNKTQINNSTIFPSVKLQEKNLNNNFNNLRTNDGHNSAFASYSNSTRMHEPKPVPVEPTYTKIMQRSTKFEVSPFQMNPFCTMNLADGSDERNMLDIASPHNNIPKISDSNDESGTEMLRFLLKIQKNTNTTNEKRPSQELYKTPPSKSQLPFPAKLIDNVASEMESKLHQNNGALNNLNLSKGNYTIQTPFVPLQVTKKKVYSSSNSCKTLDNPPKVNKPEKTINSQVFTRKSNADFKSQENLMKKKKNDKKRKFRIAANFSTSLNENED